MTGFKGQEDFNVGEDEEKQTNLEIRRVTRTSKQMKRLRCGFKRKNPAAGTNTIRDL